MYIYIYYVGISSLFISICQSINLFVRLSLFPTLSLSHIHIHKYTLSIYIKLLHIYLSRLLANKMYICLVHFLYIHI